MTILDELAEYAVFRTEEKKKIISPAEMRREAERIRREETAESMAGIPVRPGFSSNPFVRALQKPGLSFICECKKASPSKGLIARDFPYVRIAKEYETAGADAVSVLTEPKWFLGSDEYLREIAAAVSIPCLRKDFTVDEYMIYEAKTLGASAVLLIVSITGEDKLREYLEICESLGLAALVEIHDRNEAEAALHAGARIVGVNNRNLKDFTVDRANSRTLRSLIPEEALFVSESGIRNAADVQAAREIGASAVLVGETLMRAPDKTAKLKELKGPTGVSEGA